MRYDMTHPCNQCPFLKSMAHGYSRQRLHAFAGNEFPCHKTAEIVEDGDGGSEFAATPESQHCAGALIWNEKRNTPHQMMRICERLGFYDASKLDMNAEVR
jgi:hypothetical protein